MTKNLVDSFVLAWRLVQGECLKRKNGKTVYLHFSKETNTYIFSKSYVTKYVYMYSTQKNNSISIPSPFFLIFASVFNWQNHCFNPFHHHDFSSKWLALQREIHRQPKAHWRVLRFDASDFKRLDWATAGTGSQENSEFLLFFHQHFFWGVRYSTVSFRGLFLNGCLFSSCVLFPFPFFQFSLGNLKNEEQKNSSSPSRLKKLIKAWSSLILWDPQ